MNSKTPLNGTLTHPLTAHALGVLRELTKAAMPTQMINPGVIDRLSREDLIEIVSLPSPYRTHKGRVIPHAQITLAGESRVLV
jgi:hypothetical protein